MTDSSKLNAAKEQATARLLDEIEKGRCSGEEEGWLSVEKVEEHFRQKFKEVKSNC